MNLGIFPACFKKSKVIFLRKPNKTTYGTPKSFRPITLLPILAKIFERPIAKRVAEFSESSNLLHENQFGFRKGHSTTDAIVNIVETAERAFKVQKYMSAMAIDLSGAFDNCKHSLIYKSWNAAICHHTSPEWWNRF